MKITLERKVTILSLYVLVSSLSFAIFMFFSFRRSRQNEQAEELTVKRINVVGEDGQLRLVISNRERQHPGRMNGKDIPKRERESGIIFFNDEGDECGGLIHWGETRNNKTSSGMAFSMDQYHQDQAMRVLNEETIENGVSTVERGISINEYPIGSNLGDQIEKFEEIQKIKDFSIRKQKLAELAATVTVNKRLFLGKTKAGQSGLFISDDKGMRRLMIYVDEKGNPKIEVVNEKGDLKNLADNR